MSDLESEMTNSTDKDGQTVITGAWDFNGNEIILDVDGDTSITADTDDQIDFKIASADDFRMVANIFRALSGSSIETDTINETTSASGVTIDSVLLKDGAVSTDTINELGAGNGVTIDTVLLKDGNVVLSSGQGVDFSDTGDGTTKSSELFDDYEEGTWSPSIEDTSANPSESQTYTTQFGRYVKIGRQCFVTGEVTLSALGTLTTSEQAFIGNLPFTGADNNGSLFTSSMHVGFATGLAITAGQTVSGAIESDNGDRIALYRWDASTGVTALLISEVSADGRLVFSAQYEV
jgi:hypothetical protein